MPSSGLQNVRRISHHESEREIHTGAVSKLPWSQKGREEWFSLGGLLRLEACSQGVQVLRPDADNASTRTIDISDEKKRNRHGERQDDG
jgi:hypothetical protein